MEERTAPATLLSLPAELRNQIYQLLFSPPAYQGTGKTIASSRLELADLGKNKTYDNASHTPINNAPLLRVNRQLHNETLLLYYHATPFHLTGNYAEPCQFDCLISKLPPERQNSIRHIVLTARMPHLRAMNETWTSLPFGSENLELETLTIIPRRPETHNSVYAEVADLSQCHTLAYILGETLKSLRNVKRVIVTNDSCFSEVVWRLVYRSLVYRLWKWGGGLCGLGFREYQDEQVFEIICGGTFDASQISKHEKYPVRKRKSDDCRDVLQEVNRLIGGEGSRDGMGEEEHEGGRAIPVTSD